MNPLDFLQSAEYLSRSDDACNLRSAVSRAYYAVFHATKEFVESYGINFGHNSAHAKVRQIISSIDVDVAAMKIAGALAELSESRRKADYDLPDRDNPTKKSVMADIHKAARLGQHLEILRQHPNQIQIREAVRAQARTLNPSYVK